MPLPLSRPPHVTFLLTCRRLPLASFRSLFKHVQGHYGERAWVAEAERRLRAFLMEFAAGSASSKMVGMESREVPHVLAVDDNLVDRKIIETLLRNFACKVTMAENGMRALEYLGLRDDGPNSTTTASKVNLIVTDYCMPGMTGYELLKKIKGSSCLKEVPVVVVLSENVPTRINECLEEGAQMFMLKPLKQADVKKLRCHLMNCRS